MFPERLTDGYRSFLDGRFSRESSRYAMLAETGQRPEIMVVGCVDSRVSPEVIFDAAPGELLVVRNVAALVPPYENATPGSQHGTSAALEFGVQGLSFATSWCSGTPIAAASNSSPNTRNRCRRAISSPPGWRRSNRLPPG